jgi:hypothetical protein
MIVVGTTIGFALIIESREDLIGTLANLNELAKDKTVQYPAVMLCAEEDMAPAKVAVMAHTLKKGFGKGFRQ